MDIQNARVRIQWIVLDVYSNYSSWGAETARAIFSIEETLAQLYRSKVQPNQDPFLLTSTGCGISAV